MEDKLGGGFGGFKGTISQSKHHETLRLGSNYPLRLFLQNVPSEFISRSWVFKWVSLNYEFDVMN